MYRGLKFIVSDIETNGLLDTVSKFHCAWTYDTDRDHWEGSRPDGFKGYVEFLEKKAKQGYLLAFHNGIGYDWRALDILCRKWLNRGFKAPKESVFDTFVAARLIHSNVKERDYSRVRQGKLDGKLIGSHSLKAWGQRLGILKGVYGEAEPDVWDEFNEEMYEYCRQDVEVTIALLKEILRDTWYIQDDAQLGFALALEHKAQWTVTNIMQNGYPFDEDKADRLYQDLLVRRSELLFTLSDTFGSWYQPDPTSKDKYLIDLRTGKPVTSFPKVFIPKQGDVYLKSGKRDNRPHFAGAPFTRIKYVEFNPSSRDHIIKVLKENGWEPTEYTDAGNPKVDDEVLEDVKVDNPKAQACIDLIREYLMIQKRIGQIAEGKQAWLKHVVNGKIHGYINANGAVTGRATHAFPNIAQVPAIDKPYGTECREMFGAGVVGWVQVGTDASGLELRCLGHFLTPYDDGEYAHEVVNGDIHTKNQMAAGLPTRDNAKTFIYGWLYGAGAAKIGSIVGKGAKEGKALIEKFLEGLPAIANLREQLTNSLIKSKTYDPVGRKWDVKWKRRYIKGIDGRKVFVRSDHSALNTLLQSAGALICKAWIIEVERVLIENYGLKQGWDGDFALMAWVHKLIVHVKSGELGGTLH